jgi:hypothetical protein
LGAVGSGWERFGAVWSGWERLGVVERKEKRKVRNREQGNGMVVNLDDKYQRCDK